MLNSDSTGYWTQSLLVNTTKCMSLFSVNQAFCKSFFYRPISSYYFGINEPSKYLLMSRPPKAGIFFVLNLIETLNFSTKLQKMYHLANKSCGERLLPWKTEFLCILICIKKSFNSSVFLMYFRHLLTFPLSPFLIETVERRGREKFRREPPQSLFFDVEVSFDNKLDKGENDKHETQETVFHL